MVVALGAALAFAAALPSVAAAQATTAETPYTLPRTTTATVTNPAGEPYRLLLAWPEGAPPARGWPVLYVLDGEDNFAIAVLTARRLARGRSGVGDGIIVGIEAGPLPRRVRDYTPATPGWTIPKGQPASGLATGGGEAFLDMVERQVQPLVNRRWRIDPSRRIVLGHSFGGLIGLHAALTRPALFDGVAAISPSLWFGDGLLAREAAAASVRARVLIAEGDAQPDAAGAPAALVEAIDHGQGSARFLPLPGQSHGSTMLAAMAPAITFAFGEPR